MKMITDGTYNQHSLWRITDAPARPASFVDVFSDHFEAVEWVKTNGKRGEKYLIIQGDVLIVK